MLLFGCRPVLAPPWPAAAVNPLARRNGRSAGEQIERHVFVLQADPGAAKIALIDVLPEADREFLNALHVGCADAAASVKADRSRWNPGISAPQASGKRRYPIRPAHRRPSRHWPASDLGRSRRRRPCRRTDGRLRRPGTAVDVIGFKEPFGPITTSANWLEP